nr:biotin/lipoyl-binding protein [Flavobacterium oreochromis]
MLGDNTSVTEVEWQEVKERTIIETVSATGKIQPETEVKISSEISGEIIELPVKEGQMVQKGDLLAKVNPQLYLQGVNRTQAGLSNTKANLSQVEAQYKEAKANYERNKNYMIKVLFQVLNGINH